MSKDYFCNTYRGTGAIKINKSSQYPLNIKEVRILTKDGSVDVNETNIYKTKLKIYIDNGKGNKRTKLKDKSMFIDNYIYHPDVDLNSNQKFVIKSKNIFKRPWNITVSGYEMLEPLSQYEYNGETINVNDANVNTSLGNINDDLTRLALLNLDMIGEGGSIFVDHTNIVLPDAGKYIFAIVPNEESVVNNMIVGDEWDDYNGETIPVGVPIYTYCTSFRLTSGSVTLYQRSL
jgi:hypothetical protein